MSYEDTKCPCGDVKPTLTLICPACFEAFKERREMTTYLSDDPVQSRRHAALILLTLSRSRKRNQKGATKI
jgi:hypothetical protein